MEGAGEACRCVTILKSIDYIMRIERSVLNGALFPPESPTSESFPKHLHRSHLHISVRPCAPHGGLGGTRQGTLACEWAQSSPPVHRMQGLSCPGAKRQRPQKCSPRGQAAHDRAACLIGTIGLPGVWLIPILNRISRDSI